VGVTTSLKKTIVVFFHGRHWLPLRATNEAHLKCWGRYSKHRVVYINVGFGVPWNLLRHLPIDVAIFDTIFLSMHWSPEYFLKHAEPCLPLKDVRCIKIAVPQDEFINIDYVVEFLNTIGVTHILTCSDRNDWPVIYQNLDRNKVCLHTVLTGYVDETQLKRWNHLPPSRRETDIGYRAWDNPYWLGQHGRRKVEIGRAVGSAARSRGFRVDVTYPPTVSFLQGAKWLRFLAGCRAVLGVEGGASVLDKDGSIKQRVEGYLAEHPNASFEETRDQCFPDEDHAINLACLSPRHFEACITRTCQILLEGSYNGVFQPWRHYIPLKNDYSNLDEVFKALADDSLVDRITEQAYEDIISSGKWSYRKFVKDVEETIIDPTERVPSFLSLSGWVVYALLRLRGRMLWTYAHFEASRSGKSFLPIVRQWYCVPRRVLSRVKRMMVA